MADSAHSRLVWLCCLAGRSEWLWWKHFLCSFCVHMGEKFQKSALPTSFNFVRVRAARQPHVKYDALLYFSHLSISNYLWWLKNGTIINKTLQINRDHLLNDLSNKGSALKRVDALQTIEWLFKFLNKCWIYSFLDTYVYWKRKVTLN